MLKIHLEQLGGAKIAELATSPPKWMTEEGEYKSPWTGTTTQTTIGTTEKADWEPNPEEGEDDKEAKCKKSPTQGEGKSHGNWRK